MAEQANRVVESYNEWDPLEEVIVGRPEGAATPQWDDAFEAIIPEENLAYVRRLHQMHAGRLYDAGVVEPAQKEVAEFIHILEAEGVKVVRPEPMDHSIPFKTPLWEAAGGYGQFNPRDVIVVIGDELIESPMSWRSRYFEFLSYRSLVKDYFKRGARWTQAPRATMTDELYRTSRRRDKDDWEWVTSEFEPVWDAADISRCGRDIFVQRSHATNEYAIEWLRRHLGDQYRVHQLEFWDNRALHIDATFTPLAPGKLLVNPDRPAKELPECFARAGWDILECPRTTYSRSRPAFRNFEWLVMNVLSLDEKRVICEAEEEPFIKALVDWGFEPIPVHYRNCYTFGGSFHCSTVDIRRRGSIQDYF